MSDFNDVDGGANNGGSYYPSFYGDVEMDIYPFLRQASVIGTGEANWQPVPYADNDWGMVCPPPGFGATNTWDPAMSGMSTAVCASSSIPPDYWGTTDRAEPQPTRSTWETRASPTNLALVHSLGGISETANAKTNMFTEEEETPVPRKSRKGLAQNPTFNWSLAGRGRGNPEEQIFKCYTRAVEVRLYGELSRYYPRPDDKPWVHPALLESGKHRRNPKYHHLAPDNQPRSQIPPAVGPSVVSAYQPYFGNDPNSPQFPPTPDSASVASLPPSSPSPLSPFDNNSESDVGGDADYSPPSDDDEEYHPTQVIPSKTSKRAKTV